MVGDQDPGWNGRAHFFGAAAEAMRRLLIDEARKRATAKRGGDRKRSELLESRLEVPERAEELIELDGALDRFETVDGDAAQLVKLRFFAGLTMEQAAKALEIGVRTAERDWSFARAWLYQQVREEPGKDA